MKRILFAMIMLFSFSTVIYASFPVTQEATVLAEESSTPAPAPPQVDWTLAVVCFFLGGLGIHRFMMGDTTNGILMLLTAGGCGIWALIDFIRILTGDLSR
ncbi:MAG: hypothetical protein CMD06_05870 [Flavobacteriales bacterium]|nr:hypothetical protein [Flavobacteriales bacterium]MBG65459.1 hypothetical protein [Flavobacteriales bacterium]